MLTDSNEFKLDLVGSYTSLRDDQCTQECSKYSTGLLLSQRCHTCVQSATLNFLFTSEFLLLCEYRSLFFLLLLISMMAANLRESLITLGKLLNRINWR